MSAYRIYPQACTLAPLPPRTPSRPDPQLPYDPQLGPARWGKIGALYFYASTGEDDPVFGLNDIEVTLQRIGETRVRVELYAIGDGYQRGGVKGSDSPLTIRLKRAGAAIAAMSWTLPEILDGCADPITFSAEIAMNESDWRGVESVEIDIAAS
jgi:hypothetical protein